MFHLLFNVNEKLLNEGNQLWSFHFIPRSGTKFGMIIPD
jgi:hypothetical protein